MQYILSVQKKIVPLCAFCIMGSMLLFEKYLILDKKAISLIRFFRYIKTKKK